MLCNVITGVILAGGKGRRMGREKASIELEGKTLLKRVADCLADIFSDVMVVADESERFQNFPYLCVADGQRDLGPIGGLEMALRSAKNETVFLVACDMPFLHPGVIRSMIDYFDGEDLLIPRLSGRLHPLHALYTKNCLPVISDRIREEKLALHRLSGAVRCRFYPEESFRQIDPLLRSVMNINTPQDLKRARRLLERKETLFSTDA